MKIREIIYERLVSRVVGQNVALEWGSNPKTDGYIYSKKEFENRYTIINFEEMVDEILTGYLVEYSKDCHNKGQYKRKRQLKDILKIDRNNESKRKLFSKISNDEKDIYIKNILSGIKQYKFEEIQDLEENINYIDNVWLNIELESLLEMSIKNPHNYSITKSIIEILKIKFSEERIKEWIPKYSSNDANKYKINNEIKKEIKVEIQNETRERLTSSKANNNEDTNINHILNTLEKFNEYHEDLDYVIDNFFKYHIEKYKHVNFIENDYNDFLENIIREKYYARENTIPYKKDQIRKKTKKSILEKIDDQSICKMNIKELKEAYDEVVVIYSDRLINNITIKNLERFYEIEDRYNIIIYMKLAIILNEYGIKSNKEIIAYIVSKFAIFDGNIHRTKNIDSILSKLIIQIVEIINSNNKLRVSFITKGNNKQFDLYLKEEIEEFNKIFIQIKELLNIKHDVINELLKINDMNKDSINNEFTKEAWDDILKQVNELDITESLEAYTKPNTIDKIFKWFQYLAKYNNDVLKERRAIINKR